MCLIVVVGYFEFNFVCYLCIYYHILSSICIHEQVCLVGDNHTRVVRQCELYMMEVVSIRRATFKLSVWLQYISGGIQVVTCYARARGTWYAYAHTYNILHVRACTVGDTTITHFLCIMT